MAIKPKKFEKADLEILEHMLGVKEATGGTVTLRDLEAEFKGRPMVGRLSNLYDGGFVVVPPGQKKKFLISESGERALKDPANVRLLKGKPTAAAAKPDDGEGEKKPAGRARGARAGAGAR